MKKTLAFILLFATLISLCSCGLSNSKTPTNPVLDNKIDFTVPDQDIQSTAGATENSTDVTIDIDIVDEVPTNTIGFTVPSFDFDFDVGGIEVKTDHTFNFEIPSLDFEFNVTPVEVKYNGFSFEFPDYQFDFDIESFDIHTFVETSTENFSEDAIEKIEEMEVEEVVVIAETRANLLADLSHAFESSGLSVQVNEETGEISLDSSVLFDFDQYTISAEGKEFLVKFLTVYTTVVCHEKYENFIDRVLVEGHTDSDGNYNYNMTLSQERADSVKAFCLSEESGVDEAYIKMLSDSLEAIGYSSDKLVYDKNGKEDKDASRRVTFRFLIALPNS